MLLIYLPVSSSRSDYIFDKIFRQALGIDYRITNDRKEFENYPGEKINYSNHRFSDEFFISANFLLSENFIEKKNLVFGKKFNTIILFPNDEKCDIGFDIFSASFYMLSRYEEYLPFSPDEFGRFREIDSLAFKNNFLQIPVVDKWICLFKEILQKKFPQLNLNETAFKAILTYDIDVAYKFKGRGFIRNTGANLKDLARGNVKNIQQRLQTISGKIVDPWNTYDDLLKIINKNNFQSVFFFLLANRGAHDRNIDYNSEFMKALVNKIQSSVEIGIHPSFKSSEKTGLIKDEKQRLEKITGKTITKSRQHFLKFKFPETFNALIEAGIKEDYSMGFPKAAGFRAGTSKPFQFYDLLNEKSTSLTLYPVTFMEGNFMKENYSKDEVIKNISHLIDTVKSVNGYFISIWHNHTISNTKEYREWREIHDVMIQQLISGTSW